MQTPDAAPFAPDDVVGGDISGGSPAAHRGWVYALIILAAMIMLIAAVGTWVDRQALDTDSWVDASDELLANDEIRGAVAQYVVDQLYESVDVSAHLEERLPENLQRLAPTIAAALRQPVTDGVDRLLATDRAQAIWERVNRRAHETLVRVLKDEPRADSVSLADGAVTIELGELVRHIAAELGIPDSVIDRIPADAGQIVVIESDQLAAAQAVVTAVEWASVLLFLLVVALFAVALVLARGWRRVALRDVGVAVLIVGLLVVVISRLTGRYLVNNLTEVERNREVTAAVWAIASELLRDIGWNLFSVAVVILLAAAVAGSSRPAVAVRRFIAPLFLGHPAVRWGSAAVLFLLLALWAPLPVLETWYGLVVAAIALAVAIEALHRVCQRDAELTAQAGPGGLPATQPSLDSKSGPQNAEVGG